MMWNHRSARNINAHSAPDEDEVFKRIIYYRNYTSNLPSKLPLNLLLKLFTKMPGSGNCACGSIAFTYNGEHIPNLQEGKTKKILQANLPLRRFATVLDVNSGVEAHFHPMSRFQLATLRSAKERPKVGLALQMYLEKSIVTSSVEVSLYKAPCLGIQIHSYRLRI